MERSMNRGRMLLTELWQSDARLTGTGLLMLAVLVVSLVGLVLDPRTIMGAPAWLKPAKFAASIAIYTLTLAWVFTYLPAWRKTRRIVGWTTATTLVLEVVIIAAQAWRGTTSHFNVSTALDLVMWTFMGGAIVVQTLMSVAVAVALWRQQFEDRALGWALRLGLSLTILGASMGGLMTQPTAAQRAEARATHRLSVAGAHTVGAADGGPGLPGTGWSVDHGDLRVPHFIGLHALQALPGLALAFRWRRWPEAMRMRLTFLAAGSYVTFFGILLWQALAGQALIRPDATTVAALATWATMTAVVAWITVARYQPIHAHVMR